MYRQQVEHALDVSQRLTNFPIDHAKKTERHVELNQEGIDQNEVPDGHPAIDDS